MAHLDRVPVLRRAEARIQRRREHRKHPIPQPALRRALDESGHELERRARDVRVGVGRSHQRVRERGERLLHDRPVRRRARERLEDVRQDRDEYRVFRIGSAHYSDLDKRENGN